MSEYRGYRLKIEGRIFPNNLMKKGSWSCEYQRKKINSVTTADGITHENYYDDKKVAIVFSAREGRTDVHERIISFFEKKDHVRIDYWNDDLCEYVQADCKIDDISWKHTIVNGQDILYNAAKIKISEY